jgi:DNA-binding NarL/FixJ family response regulator
VADDQDLVRAGFVLLLNAATDIEVVGEARDGIEAVALCRRAAPDVVLMDVRMPHVNGLAATRTILADPACPNTRILVLTTFDEDELLWAVIEAGASGFVLKDASASDLLAAARTVAGGGAWFDPAVASRLLGAYRAAVAPHRREATRLARLTDREHDVLRLLARGSLNAEIAGTLHVSEATVKSHIGAIFAKLGVRDRAAAIVFAFDHGVVGPGRG